jgi:predicted phage replisome organizer
MRHHPGLKQNHIFLVYHDLQDFYQGSEKMAEVKWIKLSTNMFEDEKIRLIESLPESDTILIIWVKLLAQAGKTNATGYIYLNENIPFTDEMLATIFNRPIGTVRLALKTFEQFGMIEINDDHFISITNWEKHQNIDGLEKIREQERIRKQKQRAKKKQIESRDSHGTVTQGHATEEDIDKDLEREEESIDDDEASAEMLLVQKYMQLAAIPGFDLSEKERMSIRQVINEGVPIQEALVYLADCFQQYQPKHVRDKISSFNYCATFILNKYFDRKETNNGKKYRRGSGRSASEGPKEPIFGNKVGRY